MVVFVTPTAWSTSGHISYAPEDGVENREISGPRLWLEHFLLAGFLFITFVGTQPFLGASIESRSEGSPLDRLIVLALFAVALVVLFGRWRDALRCVGANLPLFLLVGFCVASILWSNFPGITLRRGMLLFFLTTIALAVAVSTDDLRRLHTVLFATLSVLVLICLLLALGVPSVGMSEIGAKGFYTQKNVAGIVAMITVVLAVTWMMGSREGWQKALALAALIPVLVFLVLTKSKTSINLTALAVLVICAFALAERYGPAMIIAGGLFGALLLIGSALWLAILDFDIDAAMRTIIGDTSFSGRDELWDFVRRDIARSYWLGHGYGAYWDVGLANDPLVRAEVGSWLEAVPIGVVNQAHDGYLDLWVQMGLPAVVIATLVTLKATFASAHYALASHEPVEDRALVGAMAAVLVIYLLHNFTEATLFVRGSIFHSSATLAIFLASHAWQVDRDLRLSDDDPEPDEDA